MLDSTSLMSDLFQRNRAGEQLGIYSVCSAHPVVIESALELAQDRRQLAVIEATCNQVNQDGGYTGMQPADFVRRVQDAADALGMPRSALVLGGDHLGPQPWRKLGADSAMDKAKTMVDAYVRAGFTKIHLDCSMRCDDDPEILPEANIAERAARLAEVAEQAASAVGRVPLYIIGTEVPPPGGMGAGHAIIPTPADSVAVTWQAHELAFARRGLSSAFDRVSAIVVQPGLDFGNEEVVHFEADQAQPLSAKLTELPGAVYEAHSTDYQLPQAYAELVAGHFAILKVGPAATFALREAIFALEAIEIETIAPARRSNMRATLEQAMLANPADWDGHYSGTVEQQAYLRHFSFSDRLRYYWTVPVVSEAAARLYANLDRTAIPLPLISQFLPQHAAAVQSGKLAATARALSVANVKRALIPYADACGQHFAP